MYLIGINDGNNASVAVFKEGIIVFALQEERLNKIKGYVGFPHEALAFSLAHLKISPQDVDAVCMGGMRHVNMTKDSSRERYDHFSKTKWERFSENPLGEIKSFIGPMIPQFIHKLRGGKPPPHTDDVLREHLTRHGLQDVPVSRFHHHMNHAATAYYGCRENETDPYLVLTLDGGGDGDCSHVYIGKNGKMELVEITKSGNSIGNIYSWTTHLLGMSPHEHEYKVMGMAAYSKPAYVQRLVEIFRGYLGFDPNHPLRFERKVKVSTRTFSNRLQRDFKRERFDNISGAVQFATEELMVQWVQKAIKVTGIRKVVAAGGVFMNVKANKLIAELEEVEYFDVFPSCGDETLSFGAVWNHHAEHDSGGGRDIKFDSFYLGPDGDFDFEAAFERYKDRIVIQEIKDPELKIAELIAEGHVVARCSGPMEFGARSLGNRSILADPKNIEVVARINQMIKMRDFWMPFAPAMLRDQALKYIHVPHSLPKDTISPWMMHTFDTTDQRDQFHAAVHAYDGTCRAQIVKGDANPNFESLLRHFEKNTGRGVVLNTSFNLHGFPIVMGVMDAVDVLLRSGLTHLVSGNRLITKK